MRQNSYRTIIVENRERPLILVVDDQTAVIRIMTNMLKLDYDVCEATSGLDAIEIVKNQQPDLILLDNLMPGISGVETCLKLKSDPATRRIPIIFVTSMDDVHNELVGLKAGAVDFIPKPPSADIVRARVKIHLDGARQRNFIERVASGSSSDLAAIRKEAKTLLS